ncbi:MAG TPA: peptidylprolyl isomerase [Actinomycetota bacterium]|nr:peptidylprolyl isomerase [Actinomycetota bacterium]
MAKKTRYRQLAKQAARRQMEKRRRQRRRQLATIAVAVVVAMLGTGFAVVAFTGGDETPPAATGPTGPTGETGPEGEPGTQTGTVEPSPGPEAVACGGEVPPAATEPKPQFNAPAQVTRKVETYTATLRTSCGDIVVELLQDRAPQTVNSFVFLAQQGFFDGTRIHRLDTSIDVIQGGDPTGMGTGGPGYTIPDELTGDERYRPGMLAMANSGTPDSGGSQFFLITGENGHNLDANATYTIFGRVIEGLDVARRIQGLPIQDPGAGISGQQPARAVYVEKVRVSATD